MLPVTADVIATSQQRLSLALAFDVNVAQWLVQPGEQVKAGQPLVQLTGPELLSFSDRLEIASHHADAAARRLTDNQQRYQQGDITRAMWLEWQHQAHQSELELAALQQQHAVLKKWQLSHELIDNSAGITLAAPTSGTVLYQPGVVAGGQVKAAEPLLSLVSGDKLQVELQLPLALKPAAIRVAACQLPLIWQSQQVNFQRRTWRSDFLTADCQAAIGQKLLVQPWVMVSAFKVPRTSLVQMGATDGVIADADKPLMVSVIVLAREGDWVFVQGDLTGRSIATADVAALKGQLMGLGAEQ